MVRSLGTAGRAGGLRARLVLLGGAALIAGAFAAPVPARAQFFWDQPRMSPDDAARAVMSRGFRPLRPPFRNDDVFVADVIDGRGRRERLIVSADSGDILQRFYIGHGVESYANEDIPPGPIPPGRIPRANNPPNVFSRLFGDDGAAQADPRNLTPDEPPPAPRPRPKRPRLVERSPETVRPSPPIESAPLRPTPKVVHEPTPEPPHEATGTPTTTSGPAPTPAATPAPDTKPGHAISRDPLAIPGSREDDDKKRAATAAAAPPPPAKTTTPAAASGGTETPPAPKSVPVAPLD